MDEIEAFVFTESAVSLFEAPTPISEDDGFLERRKFGNSCGDSASESSLTAASRGPQ